MKKFKNSVKKSNKDTKTGLIQIYGYHPSIEALKNPNRKIKNIFLTQNVHDNIIRNNLQYLLSNKPYKIIDNDFLQKNLPHTTTHQGILLEAYPLQKSDILDILEKVNNQAKSTILILDQITDPHNIGAIIRSAAAFNVDALIVTKDNSPDETSTIIKSACGAFEHIPIIESNLQKAILQLKDNNFWCIGLDVHTENSLNKINEFNKIALILGAEGDGMRKLTKDLCDLTVKIPISAKVESLNVSNTAAICLYQRY